MSSCLAWPVITDSMAAAAMFAKLSDRLGKYVCGISPPATADHDRFKAGLRSLLLLPPSPERQPRRSSSTPEDDDDDATATMSSPGEPRTEIDREEEMASTLPCLATAHPPASATRSGPPWRAGRSHRRHTHLHHTQHTPGHEREPQQPRPWR